MWAHSFRLLRLNINVSCNDFQVKVVMEKTTYRATFGQSHSPVSVLHCSDGQCRFVWVLKACHFAYLPIIYCVYRIV